MSLEGSTKENIDELIYETIETLILRKRARISKTRTCQQK